MKKTRKSKKTGLPVSSIILYTVAGIIFLIGIAALVNNIILFKGNIEHYVTQGYAYADVLKGLVPSQLLPGIFEPVAAYLGMAFVLFAAGLINQKVSQLLKSEAENQPENEPEPAAAETVEEKEAEDENAVNEEVQ
jgi:hypothetical protein